MPEDDNEVLTGNEDENEDENTDEETEEITMNKLKRSALAHYLNAEFSTTLSTPSPSWSLIGKDVEDLSVELNPDTETIKNILDETSVQDKGYEPSFDVDTYYADPSDGDFYTKLKDIAMNRKTGEDCRTLILEVLIDKAEGPFDAWVEEVIVKPTSYGGAQGGVRIPYTVTFTGNRQTGTVTIASKVPTFTPA